MSSFVYNIEDIDRAAARLWEAGKTHRVWTFEGMPGAGKTTLIAALCKFLGVTDHVSSPTFALVNEYEVLDNAKLKTIFHCDWYRLRDAEEARASGLEDLFLQPNALLLVEWPSNAPELLPASVFKIQLRPAGDDERELQFVVQ